MSFNWKDFLDTAKLLEKTCKDPSNSNFSEACYRAAISRAYYSVYNLLLNYAETNLGYPRLNNGVDHSELPKHLQNRSLDFNIKMAGKKLTALKAKRHDSDYNETLEINELDMQSMLKMADQIINTLKL